MDRNLRQGQLLLRDGLVPRDDISRAWQEVTGSGAGGIMNDLCGCLLRRGLLAPEQAARIRQEVETTSSDGAVSDDLLATIRQPPSASSSSWDVALRPASPPSSSSWDVSRPSGVSWTPPPPPPELADATLLEPSALTGPEDVGASDATVMDGARSAALSASGVSGAAPARLGDFEIRRELSRGGMGAVFVAYSLKLRCEVALKTLLSGASATDEAVRRFQLEAETTARLQHPNIVRVLDAGVDKGQHYLVMELIEGASLKAVIRDEGPLELERAAGYARDIARALAYAHRRAVLHRDIKPANILIREEDGAPLVTDFGLAKDEREGAEGLTVDGQFMGTPEYMPPEQTGGDAQLIDRRADVYALGATLYEMLTGQPPFQGPSPANVVHAVLNREPESPRSLRPEVDADLETICLTCLEKEPEKRYVTAEALAEDLEAWLDDRPIAARPPGLWERARRWRRRNRALVWAVSSAAAALLLAFGVPWGLAEWERRSRLAEAEADAAEAQRRAAAQENWREALSAEAEGAREALNEALESLAARVAAAEAALRAGSPADPAALTGLAGELRAALEPWDQAALEARFEMAPALVNAPEGVEGEARERAAALAAEPWRARVEALTARLQRVEAERAFAAAPKDTPASRDAARAARKLALAGAQQSWVRAYSAGPSTASGQRALFEVALARLAAGQSRASERLFAAAARSTSPGLRGQALFELGKLSLSRNRLTDARAALAGIPEGDAVDAAALAWVRRATEALAGLRKVELSGQPRIPLWLGDRTLVLTHDPSQRRFSRAVVVVRGDEVALEVREEVITLPEAGRARAFSTTAGLGGIIFEHGGQVDVVHVLEEGFSRRTPAPVPLLPMMRAQAGGIPVLAPAEPGREALPKPFVELRHVIDLDDNGEPEFIMRHQMDGAFAHGIWWNATRPGPPRVTQLRLLSESLSVVVCDLNGDGYKDLVVGTCGWATMGILVFEGRADGLSFEPAFSKGLGDSYGLRQVRGADGREAVRFVADRSRKCEVEELFGKELSPDKPDAVYELRCGADGAYVVEALKRLPFEARLELQMQACLPLPELVPGYPKTQGVLLENMAKPELLTLLLVPGEGLPPLDVSLTVLGPRERLPSNPVLEAYDLDEDGDLELLIRAKKDWYVFGLEAAREEVSAGHLDALLEVGASESLSAGEGPADIAHNLISLGYTGEAREVIAAALAEGGGDEDAALRLLLARCAALEGKGEEAARECLRVASRHPTAAHEALLAAADTCERAGLPELALEALERLLEECALSPAEREDAERRVRAQLAQLRLQPRLTLEGRALWSDPKVGAREPWLLDPRSEGIGILTVAHSYPSLHIPVGELGAADVVRLEATVRLDRLEWSRATGLALCHPSGHGISLELTCSGGGDLKSQLRELKVRWPGGETAPIDLNRIPSFFAPDARLEISVLVDQTRDRVTTELRCDDWSHRLVTEALGMDLRPGAYELRAFTWRERWNDHELKSAKLVWERLRVWATRDLDSPTVGLDALEVAGGAWLRGELPLAIAEAESAAAQARRGLEVVEPQLPKADAAYEADLARSRELAGQGLSPAAAEARSGAQASRRRREALYGERASLLSRLHEAQVLLISAHAMSGDEEQAAVVYREARATEGFDRALGRAYPALPVAVRELLCAVTSEDGAEVLGARLQDCQAGGDLRARYGEMALVFGALGMGQGMTENEVVCLLRGGHLEAALPLLLNLSQVPQYRFQAGEVAFRLRRYREALQLWSAFPEDALVQSGYGQNLEIARRYAGE